MTILDLENVDVIDGLDKDPTTQDYFVLPDETSQPFNWEEVDEWLKPPVKDLASESPEEMLAGLDELSAQFKREISAIDESLSAKSKKQTVGEKIGNWFKYKPLFNRNAGIDVTPIDPLLAAAAIRRGEDVTNVAPAVAPVNAVESGRSYADRKRRWKVGGALLVAAAGLSMVVLAETSSVFDESSQPGVETTVPDNRLTESEIVVSLQDAVPEAVSITADALTPAVETSVPATTEVITEEAPVIDDDATEATVSILPTFSVVSLEATDVPAIVEEQGFDVEALPYTNLENVGVSDPNATTQLALDEWNRQNPENQFVWARTDQGGNGAFYHDDRMMNQAEVAAFNHILEKILFDDDSE